MELELKKEQFACCRALPPLNDTHEETAETIVPDYLPDIGRIVDVCGCLLLRSREIVDGRASVSGLLRMTLLYVAEDGQGLKSFAYTLPLEHTMDGRLADGAADSCLEGRLCSCEVRLLNPRKILTRASVELTLSPYASAVMTVCSGVSEQENYRIETLCEKRELSMIRAIREKDFTFSDEVLLSSTKDPIRELLCTKCTLRVTDCKVVGGKLALKGVAYLALLYLDTNGNAQRSTSELPFSQILDGLSETSGETTARASLRLTGLEVHVGSESEPDNERLISLRLYISAFAVLREVRSVCCIADLYSTLYDLVVKSENVELSDDPKLFTREQSVREKIETGSEVQSILSADVSFGEAGISGSGNDAELRTSADLRVLYLDENGTPLLSERRIDVLLPTDLPVSGRVRLQGVSAGEISASVSDGGVELRFPVIFTLADAEAPCYPCLISLQAEKRTEKDESAPSLVLRALRQGERLWDLAKQYRTTVGDILAANDLAEEAAAAVGKLLLIPRRR